MPRGRPKKEVVVESTVTAVEQPQAEEKPVEVVEQAPVVEEAKPVKKETGLVVYESTGEEVTTFDILLAGQNFRAAWNADRTKFTIQIPAELCERMDKHFHVVTGRIKRRD